VICSFVGIGSCFIRFIFYCFGALCWFGCGFSSMICLCFYWCVELVCGGLFCIGLSVFVW